MNATGVYVENREVRLGKRIGKGGEGEVYVVANEAGVAVKLYTVPDKASREPKIEAMIRAGLAEKSPITAFPIALARQRSGEFAGFTMRLVTDHRPLHDLYAPGSRKLNFPRADFRFLVRAAANVARAVASVHVAGCVIGDINHSSILIAKSATVALIDADSFQVSEGTNRFGCVVGVAEYTPPELQGMSLSHVARTPNHDAFGLAVAIFLLLFMGRHPFSGSPRKGEAPSYEEAIRDFRFVYSARRDVGMDRPPGTPALSDLSSDVAMAFEGAFSREQASARPSALDWARTLDSLEKSLVRCERNKLHHVTRDSARCPWCHMEERLGTALFVAFLPAASLITEPIDLGADLFNIDAVWEKICNVSNAAFLNGIMPRMAAVSVAPSAELVSPDFKFTGVIWARSVAVGLAACVIFAAADLWWIWAPLSAYGAFGGRGNVHRKIDPTPYSKRYTDLEARWQAEKTKWRTRYGVDDFVALRTTLEAARNEYEALYAEKKRRMDSYERVRRARQLRAYLESFLIRDGKIKGIGPAKLATLASFGIETAADVTSNRLQGVPGFGPVNSDNLLTWRSRTEGRFMYRDKPTEADRKELACITNEVQSNGARLRKILIPGAENLSRLAARLKAASEMEDPLLNRLHRDLEQAKCDLAYLAAACKN